MKGRAVHRVVPQICGRNTGNAGGDPVPAAGDQNGSEQFHQAAVAGLSFRVLLLSMGANDVTGNVLLKTPVGEHAAKIRPDIAVSDHYITILFAHVVKKGLRDPNFISAQREGQKIVSFYENSVSGPAVAEKLVHWRCKFHKDSLLL